MIDLEVSCNSSQRKHLLNQHPKMSLAVKLNNVAFLLSRLLGTVFYLYCVAASPEVSDTRTGHIYPYTLTGTHITGGFVYVTWTEHLADSAIKIMFCGSLICAIGIKLTTSD
jgi:hypothetical protein